MESKLSLLEFRARLENNTEIGSPKLKLGPFGIFSIFSGSKPFYGLFDDKSFRLTMNSTLSPTFFIIKGKYKITNKILQINYSIEPSPKFYLTCIKFFPIIVFILMNLLFISAKEVPTEVFIVMNIFLAFITFYSRWKTKRKMKKLEQKFIRIFEIVE